MCFCVFVFSSLVLVDVLPLVNRDMLYTDMVFAGVKQESNSTTLMLVVVVTLFLLVEFPLGVSMSIRTVENTIGRAVVDVATDTRDLLDMFINLVILLSYPLNFFIYCAMSRRFRQEFCRTVACWMPWRPYDVSVQMTTEPLGTGAAPLNGGGGGGWHSPPEMRRDNSAVYIALTAVVVRRGSDDEPALITNEAGDDDDAPGVQL